MKYFLGFMFALFISTGGMATECPAPEGWQTMTLDDLKDTTDYTYRMDDPNGLIKIELDINNDGLQDCARFLKSDKPEENEYPYSVLLSYSQNDQSLHKTIFEAKDFQEISRYGISISNPGEYETACGSGHWECEQNEPAQIVLKNPGIDFFVFESASFLFYWDEETETIKNVAISD